MYTYCKTLAACREREKQRVHELSSTLEDLSARVHEQAIQDAETELLERESQELQRLSHELDTELAALRQTAHDAAQPSRPESPPSPLLTRSSGDTSQGSLQSSTIPCSMADPMQQHHTMYEAYEFQVKTCWYDSLRVVLNWMAAASYRPKVLHCCDRQFPPMVSLMFHECR